MSIFRQKTVKTIYKEQYVTTNTAVMNTETTDAAVMATGNHAKEAQEKYEKAMDSYHTERQGRIEWSRNLKREEFYVTVLNWCNRTVPSYYESYSSKEVDAVLNFKESFKSLQAGFYEFEPSKMQENEAIEFHAIMKYKMPAALKEFNVDRIARPFSEVWVQKHALPQLIRRMLYMFQKAEEQGPTVGNILTLTPQTADPLSLELKADQETNSMVASKMNELSQLWSQARGLNNSIEDAHALDQMKDTHIPESWRLYLSFQGAPQDSQDAAADIFGQQLSLFQSQVQAIIQKYTETNLNNMREQLKFLEAKTMQTESQSTKLTLPSQDAEEALTLEKDAS